MRDSTNFL